MIKACVTAWSTILGSLSKDKDHFLDAPSCTAFRCTDVTLGDKISKHYIYQTITEGFISHNQQPSTVQC